MDITTKAAIVDSIGSWADFGTMIIDGYTGTITDTAIDLKLASFSQNSGSFTNSKTFEAKSFSQSGGTFDSAAGTFTAGDLDVLGGNFSAPSGHGFYFRAYDDGLSNSYKLNIANEVNFTQGATDIVYFMANKSHVRKVTGKPLINAWILRDDDIAEAVTISFDDSAFTVSNDLTFKNETAKSVIVTKMITTVKGKLLAPQTPETGITQIGGVPSESVTIDLYGDLTLSDLGIDFNANLNLVGDSSDQAVKIENDAKLHNTNWTMKKAGGATVKKDVTAQSDLNFQCSLDCKFKIDDGTFKLNGKKLRIVNFEQNGGNFDGGSLGGGLTVGDLIFNAGSFYAPDLAAYDPNIQNRNGAITMIDFPEVPTHGNYKTVIASYPARYYEASFANMVYSIQKSHVREVRFTKNNISKTFFDRTVVNADDQEPRLTIVNLASGSNPAVQSQDLYIQNQTNKDYKITNLWGSARDITFPQTSAFSGKVILDETVANKAKLEVMENWDNKEDVTYIDSEKQIVLQNEVSFTDAMSYSMSKIKGSNKFKNFTVTEAGKTIQFEANKGQVVTGKLKIAGANDKKVVMKALVDPDCSASGTTALPIVSCQTAAPSAECKPAAYKPTYWVIVLEQAPEISHASISSSYNLSEKVPEIVATNSVDNCPEVNVGWKFIQTLPATISQFERVKTLVLNSISSIVDFAKRVVAF